MRNIIFIGQSRAFCWVKCCFPIPNQPLLPLSGRIWRLEFGTCCRNCQSSAYIVDCFFIKLIDFIFICSLTNVGMTILGGFGELKWFWYEHEMPKSAREKIKTQYFSKILCKLSFLMLDQNFILRKFGSNRYYSFSQNHLKQRQHPYWNLAFWAV